MAIAFSAIVPDEKRAPANPVAVKGNTLYTRAFRVVVPASTTVADLVLGKLAKGTLVHDVVMDTDTSFGTSTLALKTTDATFVAATTLVTTGGKQMTRAAGLGVAVKSSSDDLDLTLTLGTAPSPASEVTLDITLVCSGIGPVEDTYATQST